MDSWDRIYRRYAPVLRKFVAGMLKDSVRAEDIVHNIFMRLLSGKMTFESEESLRNWLYVCARNEVISTLRSKWERGVVKVGEFSESIQSPEPDDGISRETLSNTVVRALDRMPRKREEVFRLVKLEKLSPEEAARQLGISVRTVQKHLQLAYEDIRHNLS